MMREFQFILRSAVLFVGVFGVLASEAESPVCLEVFPDGKAELDHAPIIPHLGISIPEVILKAQTRPPVESWEADRKVWFSFEDLGLLVVRKNDPKGAHANLVLPAFVAEPFEKIQFKGRLRLGSSQIDFSTGRKITRKNLLESIEKAAVEGGLTQDENSMTLTLGDTVVYFFFEPADRLQHVMVALKVRE